MAEEYSSGCSQDSLFRMCPGRTCESKKKDLGAPANAHSQVKRVIGVISGKGGVGKSLVTGSLARMMREKGYTVGILDADITGPSIPKMYDVHEMAKGTEDGYSPVLRRTGQRIMSVNLCWKMKMPWLYGEVLLFPES